MRVVDEIKKLLTAVGDQFTYRSKSGSQTSRNTGETYFTSNFEQKAKQWGLSEADGLDVYHHGQDRKPNMRCRTYNGYELCIYYGHSARTGQPYISTIWKRDRR